MEKQLKGNDQEFENMSVEKKIKEIANLFNQKFDSCTKPMIFKLMFQVLEFSENEREFLQSLKTFEKLLLKKQMTLYQLKFKGKNILMSAIEKNYLNAIQKIIAQKFDFEQKDFNGETAVFYLASLKRKQNQEIEELILRQEINLTVKNNRNETVLMKSIKNKFENLSILLLKKNFDQVTQIDNNGLTPLHFIFQQNHKKLLKIVQQNLKKEIFQTMLNSCQQSNQSEQIIDQYNLKEDVKTQNKDENKKMTLKQRFKNLPNSKKLSLQLQKNGLKELIKNTNRRKSEQEILLDKQSNIEKSEDNKEIIQNYKNQISEIKQKIQFFQQQNQKLRKQKSKINQKQNCKKNKKENSLCKQTQKQAQTQIDLQQQTQLTTDNLHIQIQSYQKFIQNYQETYQQSILKAQKTIKKNIMNYFEQGVDIKLAGSISNQLNMPWSDINIHIFPKKNFDNYKKRNKYYKTVSNFKTYLSQLHQVKDCSLQKNLSLTIINFTLLQESQSYKIELMFRFKQFNIPENDEIIKNYLNYFPIAKPIYLTFKRILHKHKLDNPFYGGLNNLCIITLIIAFLKQIGIQQDDQQKQKDLIENSLGQIFQNFLYFYTFQFDYNCYGIQLQKQLNQTCSPFFIKNQRYKGQQLVINHPLKQNNMITKSFKKTDELKQVIRFSYFTLYQNCACKVNMIQQKVQNLDEDISSFETHKKHQADDKTTIFESPLDKFQSIVVNYRKKMSEDIGKIKEVQEFGKDEIQSIVSHSTKLDSLFYQQNNKNKIEPKFENIYKSNLIEIFNLNLQYTTL